MSEGICVEQLLRLELASREAKRIAALSTDEIKEELVRRAEELERKRLADEAHAAAMWEAQDAAIAEAEAARAAKPRKRWWQW